MIQKNTKEVWKEIEGYSGYSVSTSGKVFSALSNKILKPQKDKRGYLRVCLRNHLGGKYFFIHRLVANAFIPNPENKPQVNHKSAIKSENWVENLEWATNIENKHHAMEKGLCKLPDNSGEKNTFAKLTEGDVKEIRSLKGKKSAEEIATQYGVISKSIRNIFNNKTWQHL